MNILDLIPQRPPMVMVDALLGMKDGISYSELRVRKENIFVSDGRMSECGLLEHMAQSAAARNGYLFRSQGKEIPLGYIASIQKFKLYSRPGVGDIICTKIRVVQEVLGISVIEAESRIDGQLTAVCQMKIFLDENENEK